MRNAVGFYWTLPVPWAGFTELPKDIDAAAKASRTIRYQCERIRRHAESNGYKLVAEEVFLEIAPDRGSRYVLDALRPLEAICRARNSVLLYVDFSEVQGWRGHGPLSDWGRHTGIEVETLYPDTIMIDGAMFDPHRHFSEWGERHDAWKDGKNKRVALAYDIAFRLHAEKKTYKEIAQTLNDQGITSATGKRWTIDNVRKQLPKSTG